MENETIRKIIWAAMLAMTGALATVSSHRVSEMLWKRMFNEEPPT